MVDRFLNPTLAQKISWVKAKNVLIMQNSNESELFLQFENATGFMACFITDNSTPSFVLNHLGHKCRKIPIIQTLTGPEN